MSARIVIEVDSAKDLERNVNRVLAMLHDAAQQARVWQENSPLRSQDPSTDRYEWAKVAAALKTARVMGEDE